MDGLLFSQEEVAKPSATKEDHDLLALIQEYRVESCNAGKAIINGFEIGYWTLEVTPELAEEFLSRNISNRPISKSGLKSLKDEMKADRWIFNGDPIRFNSRGELCDGQHRLTAMLELGKTYEFHVTTGLDPEAFKTIDMGTKRNGGDILSIKGIPNATNAAAATKFIYSFRNSKYHGGL